MKYLTSITAPKLTITHTSRRAIADEVTQRVVLTETITRIEITLPALLADIRAKFRTFLQDVLTPNLAHYCACA